MVPAWLAVIVQVPVVRMLATVPLTVQTLVVPDAKLTVRPVAVVEAERDTVKPLTYSCGPGSVKVMVCGVPLTVNVWLTDAGP